MSKIKNLNTGSRVDGDKQFLIRVYFYANERYDPVKHFITRKYDDNFESLLSDLATTFRAPFAKVIALYDVEKLERITKTKELGPDSICLAAGKVLASSDLKRSAKYIIQKGKDSLRRRSEAQQPLKSRSSTVLGSNPSVAALPVSYKTKVSDDRISETTTQETKETIKDAEKKIVTTVTTITTTKKWKRVVEELKEIPETCDKYRYRLSRRASKDKVGRQRSHSLPPEEKVFNIKVKTSANEEEITVDVNTRMDWKSFMNHVKGYTKQNISRIVANNQEPVRSVYDLQEDHLYLALEDNDIRRQKRNETSKPTTTRRVSLSRKESLSRRESFGSTFSLSPCRTDNDCQQFPFLYTSFHLNGDEDDVEPINMIFYPYELELLSRILAALSRRFQNNRRIEKIIENIHSVDGALISRPDDLKAGEHYVAVPEGEIFQQKKYNSNVEEGSKSK